MQSRNALQHNACWIPSGSKSSSSSVQAADSWYNSLCYRCKPGSIAMLCSCPDASKCSIQSDCSSTDKGDSHPQALADREEAVSDGRLQTIIFIRDVNARGQEVSGYIDFDHRLPTFLLNIHLQVVLRLDSSGIQKF